MTFHYLSSTQGTLTGTSDWLEIDTNATSATLAGTLGFIGDDGQKFYEPTPTPEPATTGVVAAALALMALVARRQITQENLAASACVTPITARPAEACVTLGYCAKNFFKKVLVLTRTFLAPSRINPITSV